jgi:hypothetical protein
MKVTLDFKGFAGRRDYKAECSSREGFLNRFPGTLGFREISLGVPREIVIEKINIVF